MSDAAQHGTPFDNHAIDIAGSEKLRDPSMFAEWIFVDALDHFAGAPTVTRRHTVFQIPGNALDAVSALANHREPARPTIVVMREAKARVEIGQIVNQFIDVIALVLQCRGHCEPIALGKKAHNAPT